MSYKLEETASKKIMLHCLKHHKNDVIGNILSIIDYNVLGVLIGKK